MNRCKCATVRSSEKLNLCKFALPEFFHPFSDFLLHDMGSLGDGITQNGATGQRMRTQPLWGLRTQARMLHDGRATTLRQAILAHDGQGAASREAFRSLGFLERTALIAFLQSL